MIVFKNNAAVEDLWLSWILRFLESKYQSNVMHEVK